MSVRQECEKCGYTYEDQMSLRAERNLDEKVFISMKCLINEMLGSSRMKVRQTELEMLFYVSATSLLPDCSRRRHVRDESSLCYKTSECSES